MIALGVLAGQLGEVGEHIAYFNAVVIGKDGQDFGDMVGGNPKGACGNGASWHGGA